MEQNIYANFDLTIIYNLLHNSISKYKDKKHWNKLLLTLILNINIKIIDNNENTNLFFAFFK